MNPRGGRGGRGGGGIGIPKKEKSLACPRWRGGVEIAARREGEREREREREGKAREDEGWRAVARWCGARASGEEEGAEGKAAGRRTKETRKEKRREEKPAGREASRTKTQVHIQGDVGRWPGVTSIKDGLTSTDRPTAGTRYYTRPIPFLHRQLCEPG